MTEPGRVSLAECPDRAPRIIAGASPFAMRMVERGLEDRQNPVRCRAASAHGFGAGVCRPMLRGGTGLGAQPRGGLGDLLMPSDDFSLCQPVEHDGADFGLDPRSSGPIEAINRLTTAALVVGAVIGERVGDGVGTIKRHEIAGCLSCLALKPPARPQLRLCETVHAEPVRVARIIGGTECLKVALAIGITELGNPSAALRATAIAKRASRR